VIIVGEGCFSDEDAQKAAINQQPYRWWYSHGANLINDDIRTVGMKLTSGISSQGATERNWYAA
jgi:hypothetical protein